VPVELICLIALGEAQMEYTSVPLKRKGFLGFFEKENSGFWRRFAVDVEVNVVLD
jgi:hypothetical protein